MRIIPCLAFLILLVCLCTCFHIGNDLNINHPRAPVTPLARSGDTVRGGVGENGDCTIEKDVCIGGSGYSGMFTALYVKRMGGDPLILEIDDRYGGNCNTVLDNSGVPLDIGQFAFTNTTTLKSLGMEFWGDFDSVKVLNELTGGRVVPFTLGGSTPTYLTNFYTGENYTSPYTPEEFNAAFGRLFALISKYPWFDPAVRPSPIPEELLKSFSEIIVEYQLEPLVPTLFPNTVTAIADYDDVLALYALIDLKLALLYIFTQNDVGMFINGGCINVFDGIVNEIGRDKVLLNAEYLRVKRPNANSNSDIKLTVKYRNGEHSRIAKIKCKSFVVAFPATGESIEFLHPDERERKAFGPFTGRFWATMAWNATGPLMQPGSSFQLYNRDPTQPFGVPKPPCVQSVGRRYPFGKGSNYLTSKTLLSSPQIYEVFENNTDNISTGFIDDMMITDLYRHINYQPNAPEEALRGDDNVYAQIYSLNQDFHRKTLHRGTTFGDNDATVEMFYGMTAAKYLKSIGIF